MPGYLLTYFEYTEIEIYWHATCQKAARLNMAEISKLCLQSLKDRIRRFALMHSDPDDVDTLLMVIIFVVLNWSFRTGYSTCKLLFWGAGLLEGWVFWSQWRGGGAGGVGAGGVGVVEGWWCWRVGCWRDGGAGGMGVLEGWGAGWVCVLECGGVGVVRCWPR